MYDKHQITEEPCEGKPSCTVLKTNGVGDNLVEFNNSYLIPCFGLASGSLHLFK